MVYESSYESGRKPFQPDPKRGHWAVPSDFLYACWALAFQADIVFISWMFFLNMGIYSIISYLFCLVLCVVPIIMIQSFLGQFSSSGFISVFRIAPLFKGIGFISLAINFMMISHLSVFAAISLFYLFHSIRPTLPWSCESFLQWSTDVPNDGHFNICNNKTYGTSANATVTTTTIISLKSNETFANVSYAFEDASDYKNFHIPSVIFFQSLFKEYELSYGLHFSLSWELVLCMLLVWAVIAFIFHKISHAEKIGKIVRFTMWLLVPLLLIIVLRMAFLPHSGAALRQFFMPEEPELDINFVESIPVFILAACGTGWGNIISLASYNKFRVNVMRYSWFISLGQMVFIMLFGFVTILIDTHYEVLTEHLFSYNFEFILYMASGSIFADLELPNMWCILFFSMLLLSTLLVLIIQIFALLSAIFDEFEFLRAHREKITLTLIALFALSSIYFCSNYGLTHFYVLPADALFTQTALNLLLLLVILWIYGRVRFQRDMEFMLGQLFATWRVYVLRFITPLVLFGSLFCGVTITLFEHYFQSSVPIFNAAVFCIVIPWLFIPGYAIMGMVQTTGSLRMRFKRCCRPTDWYPIDAEERQRYEDNMNNMDITHQLNEVDA